MGKVAPALCNEQPGFDSFVFGFYVRKERVFEVKCRLAASLRSLLQTDTLFHRSDFFFHRARFTLPTKLPIDGKHFFKDGNRFFILPTCGSTKILCFCMMWLIPLQNPDAPGFPLLCCRIPNLSDNHLENGKQALYCCMKWLNLTQDLDARKFLLIC